MTTQKETPPDTAMSGGANSASLSTIGIRLQYLAIGYQCKLRLGVSV